MSNEEIENGSFIPTEKSKLQKHPPPTDANAPLFKLMREIRDVIKENTEALNSLLTVVLTQKPISVTTRPELKQYEEAESSEPYKNIGDIPLPQPEPETSTPEVKPTSDLELIKGSFPNNLAELLIFTFESELGLIKVKPRQFLGSDNFAKIASIVRELDGEYISAGKESHFRIRKPE